MPASGNRAVIHKALLDALVIEGLVFDDSPDWLDCTYHQAKCRRGESRTVVEVSW